jgi:hypothetical protein
MPVTPNEACVGKFCGMCGGPATHAYGLTWLCCDCHTGEPGGGIYTREQAERIHRGEDPCPELSADPGPGLRELEAWGKAPPPF